MTSPSVISAPSDTSTASSITLVDGRSIAQWSPPPHTSFPPFYTLQPNLATRAAQLHKWSTLFLSHARAYRSFSLSTSSDLFTNSAISRSLPLDERREVLAFMVSKGVAAWTSNPTPTSASNAGSTDTASVYRRQMAAAPDSVDTVYLWHSSPAEHGAALLAWADSIGKKNTVLTLWEVLEGNETRNEVFHALPIDMARVVLKSLQKQGKAQLFGGTGGGAGEGMKLF